MKELAGEEELAAPALRKVLEGKPSLEVRKRVESLLDALKEPVTSSEKLRLLRAVETLERADSPEARALLERLAQGTPEARLTREAKAALQRLARRPVSEP
jgi:hypothetical protein